MEKGFRLGNMQKYGWYCLFFLGILISFSSETIAQEKKEYSVLYYPNGAKASEGYMRDGQPDGYWISYYPNGTKKSEGNRKNFLLDSIWVFYNQLGDTAEKISYFLGKKNGYSIKYGYVNDRVGKERVIIVARELYINDVKEGNSYYYDKQGNLREIVKYRKGKRDGITFVFNKDSLLTEIREYRNDFPVLLERLNRYDSLGRKDGIWREYFPDGKIKEEAVYKNGVYNGVMKRFNEKGALILSLLYKDGRIVEENPKLEKAAEVKTKVNSEGWVEFNGAFIDDSVPVGIHRWYNKDGKVVRAELYGTDGKLISEGIIDNEGKREGMTVFYYPDRKILSKGEYKDNKREGRWKFYGINGVLEQEGEFRNDMPNGLWTWYYPDQTIKRTEAFLNGKEDGEYMEYDNGGKIIAKGVFVEGEKEGEWFYHVGDHSEIGKYISGLRDGIWRYYYENGNLQFEGRYVQGNLDGKVKWFYDDGKIMEEQYYINGIREKTWKKYDRQGNIVLTVTYAEDVEVRINGVKVEDSEREIKLIR